MPMDVVVLLSGGKDSCFSALKAKTHGHRIVAFAHISASCEEADSFMYQSVGSTAVAHVAKAFGCPLVTRPTHAKAKRTTLHYSQTEGDEVEDLVDLLMDVKNKFPYVDAVCSGALWSDYQRLRVENAARRVGLSSLAPLWRRNQEQLLAEMIACGVDAVLIKVAGAGLNESHLGKSLAEMQPTLLKLNRLYDSHICGEGGEYETLVRWIPGMTHRLSLDDVQIVMHEPDEIAPVSFLRLNQISLQPLTDEQRRVSQVQVDSRQPIPGDSLFHFDPVFYGSDRDSSNLQSIAANDTPNRDDACFKDRPTGDAPTYLERSALGVGTNYVYVVERSEHDGAQGVQQCCTQLIQRLQLCGDAMSGIVFVQLYLRRVDGRVYKEANRAYNEFFEAGECVSPPARACVGVDSHFWQARTTVEALVRRGDRVDTRSLHVESISEWAPPCIGPYSQFIEEDDVVHVSGVLPLHPPSVTVLEGMSAERQLQVCWQNLRRTLEAGRGHTDLLGLIVVFSCVPQAAAEVGAMLKQLQPSHSIAVQVPVRSLPKGAAVEIKAVGVLNPEHRHLQCIDVPLDGKTPDGSTLLSCKRVVCGNMAFAVFEGREPFDVERALLCISAVSVNDQAPLSVVVHLRKDEQPNIGQLKQRLEQTEISMFSSAWMPTADMYWIAMVTFETDS